MESTTQKPRSISGSSLLLGLACCIIFFALVYLSTCNHANTDDYYLGYHLQNKGWWGYQQHIYLHWGGRYFTNFMGVLFAADGFLYRFYFVHTIMLLVAGWAAVYYLLATINRYWWYGVQQPKHIGLMSGVLLAGSIAALPEPATAYYWFSSAITYQFSLILLVCLLANLIRITHSAVAKWRLLHLATLGLVVAITGANEIAALATGMLLMIVWITHMRTLRIHNTFVAIVAIIYTICLLLLCTAPGNRERLTIISGNHLIGAIGIAIIRIAYTYWYILQSSLTWVLLVIAFVLALRWKNKIVVANKGKSIIANVLILVSILSIVLFIIMLPILYFSNGSWPERATNVLATIGFAAFLMTAFYAGLQCNNPTLISCSTSTSVLRILKMCLILTVVCNSFSKDLFKSLISAKMFHIVMQQREQILHQHKGKEVCFVPAYDTAFRKLYPIVYAKPQRATIAQFIAQKPTLLFVYDDLADANAIALLQQYYQIKTIIVPR